MRPTVPQVTIAAPTETPIVEETPEATPEPTIAPVITEAPSYDEAPPVYSSAPTYNPPPAPDIATPEPTLAAKTSSCAASYPDFCIPPPPPDLNCKDVAPHHNFTVLWNVPDPDPHHFDADHDGIGCES